MRDAATHQITGIEADITTLIDRDPAIAEVVAIIAAIPGPVTAVTVAALMPELGMMTGRQAASLAGLAPHPHQSGQRDGYRRVRGGRPEVKRALFMAALAARNHNRTLKTVYQRLIANGKKPIVAITALMRKLITIINARIRDARRPPLGVLRGQARPADLAVSAPHPSCGRRRRRQRVAPRAGPRSPSPA